MSVDMGLMELRRLNQAHRKWKEKNDYVYIETISYSQDAIVTSNVAHMQELVVLYMMPHWATLQNHLGLRSHDA